MKVVTAEEMRAIDRKTIEKYGISSQVLMERAGLSVAIRIRELCEKRKVIVLSAGGNNGGDGIAAARNLFNWGWNVKVLLFHKEEHLNVDCLVQYTIAKKMGIPVEFRKSINRGDLHSALVVDAIFGTGINKPVTSPLSDIISFLNKTDTTVISVDIPSGVSAENGQIRGEAVRATYTVTFGLPKVGHFIYPGAEYTGKLFVEDIGFPYDLLTSTQIRTEMIERRDVSALIPQRPAHSSKRDYGHIFIVAGSRGKAGAAFMAAKACLRAGAGLVTIGVPDTLAGLFQARVTEEMVLPLPDTGKGVLSKKSYQDIMRFLSEKANILAIGPGLTSAADIADLMKLLLTSVTVPMVLDADGITVLSGSRDILKKVKAPVILTPHPGEMAQLLKGKQAVKKNTASEIERNRIHISEAFAQDTGAYLVLKGAPTVIAEPEGRVFINATGNPGMAKAGSGDVLTGMIAALLGQGLNPLDASVFGVYLHGFAGDIAAAEKGLHSVIATDIIENIPAAFVSLKSSTKE
jgi:ADP-dependent NAD(P)H-hydrate dehydratase / NAD(P)H-hydrate epimerase